MDRSCKKNANQFEKNISLPLRKLGASFLFYANQYDYDRRLIALDLQKEHSLDAIPIYSNELVYREDFRDGNQDALRVIFNKIPEPDAETESWERILDFRNDPDTKVKLNRFRYWMANIMKQQSTEKEMLDEFEYCYNDYEEHINFHQMKIKKGIIESLLTVSAEAIEGILKKSPKKTLDALFYFQHIALVIRIDGYSRSAHTSPLHRSLALLQQQLLRRFPALPLLRHAPA